MASLRPTLYQGESLKLSQNLSGVSGTGVGSQGGVSLVHFQIGFWWRAQCTEHKGVSTTPSTLATLDPPTNLSLKLSILLVPKTIL